MQINNSVADQDIPHNMARNYLSESEVLVDLILFSEHDCSHSGFKKQNDRSHSVMYGKTVVF